MTEAKYESYLPQTKKISQIYQTIYFKPLHYTFSISNHNILIINIIIPQNKEISKEADTKPEPTGKTKTATPNATTTSKTCTTIKGNIGNGTKIYHVPGGSFYERTQEEMCFATELEAQTAGFVKSKR